MIGNITKRELARRINVSYAWIDCILERPEFQPFLTYEVTSLVKKVRINDAFKKELKAYFEKRINEPRTNWIKKREFKKMLEENLSCLD